MSVRCVFFPHRWVWFTNFMEPTPLGTQSKITGLYQCWHCKRLSIGMVRGVGTTLYDAERHSSMHSGV